MRVLHVAEALGGGILEFVRVLADGAAEEGHHVAVAHGRRPETPDSLEGEFDPTVELHPLPWTSRSPVVQAGAAREIRGLVRRWEPDVVHLHSSFAGVLGGVALDRERVCTLWTPNAYPSMLPETGRLSGIGYRRLERFASRRARLVGAVSTSEADLAKAYVGDDARVALVENGIRELDPAHLGDRWSPPEVWSTPRVIGLGRTVPQRRPEACARILSNLRDVADVAWVGGAGGDRGTAGFSALRADGIEPTGWVPRDRVMEELRRATAYLHWTAWDGQAFSILEAMACDAVVIASDIPPNREILGGRQVCATEAEATELVRRVVLDRDFAEELLTAQRERRSHYGAERMVGQWLAVYERLTGRRPRPTRRFARNGDAAPAPERPVRVSA